MPGERKERPIDPPSPAEKQDQDTEGSVNNSKIAQTARLRAQEKEFRETMSRLFSKVSDLKTKVDALHPSDVFSVTIFKQTQEIEKLAKQLKTYAKP
jgi:hypothetical protein